MKKLKICSMRAVRYVKKVKDSFEPDSNQRLGSITSRFSGNEPALLPRMHGWTREDSFVSLNQSDNRPQIFVGHKLSR